MSKKKERKFHFIYNRNLEMASKAILKAEKNNSEFGHPNMHTATDSYILFFKKDLSSRYALHAFSNSRTSCV